VGRAPAAYYGSRFPRSVASAETDYRPLTHRSKNVTRAFDVKSKNGAKGAVFMIAALAISGSDWSLMRPVD
jgi:hypothetical protein